MVFLIGSYYVGDIGGGRGFQNYAKQSCFRFVFGRGHLEISSRSLRLALRHLIPKLKTLRLHSKSYSCLVRITGMDLNICR